MASLSTIFSLLAMLLLVKANSELSDVDMAGEENALDEYKRHPRETNVVNFVRLLVLRLIYGFASMFGFEEGISEIGDGALVPPGVDDDYGFDDDNRDYNDYY